MESITIDAVWVAAAANERGSDPAEGDAALGLDADYQAWLDARVAAAIAAQDDAELTARRWGPEPEFMLRAAGGGHGA
jgi:hypothetical protein